MGLFSSKPVFKSKKDIKKAVQKTGSLDWRQKPEVMKALERDLDYGGVSRQELKKTTSRLRREGKISDIDKKKISGW